MLTVLAWEMREQRKMGRKAKQIPGFTWYQKSKSIILSGQESQDPGSCLGGYSGHITDSSAATLSFCPCESPSTRLTQSKNFGLCAEGLEPLLIFFLVKFAEMEKKRHEDFKGRWFLWGRQPKELRITAMMSRLPRLGFEGWALNTYSILYVFPAWSLCSYFRTTEWLKRIKIIPTALGNAKHSQTSYHRPSIQATWIRDFCHWCQNIIPEFLNHKRE